MSDNPLESAGTSGGQAASPTPSGANGQPPSIDVEALTKVLEPWLDRKLQSTKDKRISELEKGQSDFRAKLARLEELQGAGMSKAQAVEYMDLEAKVERVSQPAQVGSPQPVVVNVNTEDLLDALGIPSNDPEVSNILRQGGDPTSGLVSLAKKRKAAPAPTPNPATVLPTGGGGKPPVEDLMSEYNKEKQRLMDAEQYGEPLLQLRRKYREKGLAV
jgi:hypothetical protein